LHFVAITEKRININGGGHECPSTQFFTLSRAVVEVQ